MFEYNVKNLIYDEFLKSSFRDLRRNTSSFRKPKKYIINKNATILFWEDGTKTVVKLSKDDTYDKEKGFLWAYFQKHSGLSRTQANKYLNSLKEATHD